LALVVDDRLRTRWFQNTANAGSNDATTVGRPEARIGETPGFAQ
jgi:hypothetical protein